MNQQQINSITKHLNAFIEKLTNEELVGLIRYICYKALATPFEKPDKIASAFIDEFFGEITWAKILSDERDSTKIFMSASLTERELVRHMRIALMQESFFRLAEITDKPKIKKVKTSNLSKEDKKDLTDILVEHRAMLKYQLEDEDAIRSVDEEAGDKLVDEKKKHLAFIEKTIKNKLF